MSRLQNHYKTVIVQDLLETFNYKSVNDLPYIEKITLNCGLRYNNFNHKKLAMILAAFELNTSKVSLLKLLLQMVI